MTHALRELSMLGFNLSDCHVHDLGRSTGCVAIRSTTNRLHELHSIDFGLELVVHMLDTLFYGLYLLLYGISVDIGRSGIFVNFGG